MIGPAGPATSAVHLVILSPSRALPQHILYKIVFYLMGGYQATVIDVIMLELKHKINFIVIVEIGRSDNTKALIWANLLSWTQNFLARLIFAPLN